jgi:hypothetical protein
MTTMKKILAYTLAAVLLGIVTLLAPFALLVSETDINELDTQAEPFYSSPTEYMKTRSSKMEQAYGITPITHSTDIVFIVFLFVFSLVIALGVMSYFKRKTFSSCLP